MRHYPYTISWAADSLLGVTSDRPPDSWFPPPSLARHEEPPLIFANGHARSPENVIQSTDMRVGLSRTHLGPDPRFESG